ncbi:TetR/AcrR family transcriptional regulator [Inconstantimicrobium mannanitabidum]|uniref:TetR family transcriptional regulator n=1 Tax=Inconstantimicrobium mannanitabidum TaxID=1604901 RepID=A0ACB5R7Y1_9CLOT|nr:TetR/AcrR family transcriptional regulator [Clostridium sp. TW13]GKX65298.1 TetR family transcriptional regulator [Clostridium sp. TW13]
MKQHAKIAIINSFKELINEQCIDKVTVKEICKRCDVNRQTFYYYFTDIMDIFKFVVYQELSEEIAQNRTFETWEGGFLATMNYMKKNSRMFLHIYNSSYWSEANNYFTNFSNKLLDDVVTECVKNMNVKLSEKDELFIVNFYRHVFNGLIIDWMREGMEGEPETILKKLMVMITGSIPRSVSTFAGETAK